MKRLCPVAVLALAACSGPAAREAAPTTPKPAPATTASPPAPTKQAARSFHTFVPSQHGFHFRNGFQGQILGAGESAYGLCGGMSFAAADYFLANRPIPADIHAPADGTPLFKYIYSRQATSFGTLGGMGLKFVEWMQLPDDSTDAQPDSTHSRTLEGLPAITGALSRGEPVVLGLVLTSTAAKGKAWDNHQVLALSSTETATGQVDIRIYDSNFPNRDDVTISITRNPTRIAMHIPGRRDMAIRGFFRMAYSPIVPTQ